MAFDHDIQRSGEKLYFLHKVHGDHYLLVVVFVDIW